MDICLVMQCLHFLNYTFILNVLIYFKLLYLIFFFSRGFFLKGDFVTVSRKPHILCI